MKFTCDEDLIALMGGYVKQKHPNKELLVIGVYKQNDWKRTGQGHILCTYAGEYDEDLSNLYTSNKNESALSWCNTVDIAEILDRLCWVNTDDIVEVIPHIKDKRWLSTQLLKEYNNVL